MKPFFHKGFTEGQFCRMQLKSLEAEIATAVSIELLNLFMPRPICIWANFSIGLVQRQVFYLKGINFFFFFETHQGFNSRELQEENIARMQVGSLEAWKRKLQPLSPLSLGPQANFYMGMIQRQVFPKVLFLKKCHAQDNLLSII